MLFLGARKNKWSFYLDTIYVDLEGDDKGNASLAGGPSVETEVDIGVEAYLITASGGYAIIDTDRTRIELLAGVRYYWEDLSFEVDLGPLQSKTSESFTLWDGIVGVKGNTELTDHWHVSYLADVGTGDTDLSYQLFGAIGYEFSKMTLATGYRYMEWQFDRDSFPGDVVEKQVVRGPFVGLKFIY